MSVVYETYVKLKIKENQEDNLVQEIRNYISAEEDLDDDCRANILKAKNIKELVERIFGGDLETSSYVWLTDNEFSAFYDAMNRWWNIMDAVRKIMKKKKYNDGMSIRIKTWD